MITVGTLFLFKEELFGVVEEKKGMREREDERERMRDEKEDATKEVKGTSARNK